MKITYLTNQYRENRNLCMKIAEPDNGATERFVLALHGFAGSMESWAITVGISSPREHPTRSMLTNVTGSSGTYRIPRPIPIIRKARA